MAFTPKKITKDIILKTLQKIKDEGIKLNTSTKFDVEINGELFPPKEVMRYAHKELNGEFIWKLTGGEPTNKFLRDLGYKIIHKKESEGIEQIITKYKARIKETKLENEIYKWKLLKEFNGRPNLEAEDLFQEVKSVKFQNLVYAMGIAVLNELVRNYPEEMRRLLGNLFNDDNDLKTRINTYSEESLKLYRQNEEKLSHHQDERSISSYLAFQDANKYPLYKDSFYKKFCKLNGVKSKSKGDKYVHYKVLLEDFIDEYIKPDQELIDLVRSYLPEDAHEDKNNYILAQDILYQMLDQYAAETNYWVFQCNPNFFDIKTSLRNEILDTWTVSAHKDKIKPGDKVIIWVTGDESGCYALAEVTSEPHPEDSSEDDKLWKTEKIGSLKADIKITHNLVENPILKNVFEDFKEFENFKAGAQGTNFSSNKEEYDKIISLIDEKAGRFNDYKTNPDFDIYIKHLKDLISDLNLQKDDPRAVFSVTGDKLTFTIGQRYCFTFYTKDKRGIIGFISTTPLSEEYSDYNGKPEAYLNFRHNIKFSPNEWNNIVSACKIELKRTTKSSYLKYSDNDFINYLFNTSKQNIVKVDLPKNLSSILISLKFSKLCW